MTSDNGSFGTLQEPWASVEKMYSLHKPDRNKNKLSQATKVREYHQLFQNTMCYLSGVKQLNYQSQIIALVSFFKILKLTQLLFDCPKTENAQTHAWFFFPEDTAPGEGG